MNYDLNLLNNFINNDYSINSDNPANDIEKKLFYSEALSVMLYTEDWLENPDLVETLFSRIQNLDNSTSEFHEKVTDIYRKIFNSPIQFSESFLDEHVKNSVKIKLSNNRSIDIPKDLLLALNPAFKFDQNNTINLSGKADIATLNQFVRYIQTGKTDFIATNNILDILMLAQEFQLSNLITPCIEFALDPENHWVEQLENKKLNESQKVQMAFIQELKKHSITISYDELATPWVEIPDASNKEQWKTLSDLNSIYEIRHLRFVGEKDFNSLTDFLQHNSSIESLDLGESPEMTDQQLEKISIKLDKIKDFRINGANITTIPPGISDKVVSLDCNNCPLLKELYLPNVFNLSGLNCSSLKKVVALKGERVHLEGCTSLEDLDLGFHAIRKLNVSQVLRLNLKDFAREIALDLSNTPFLLSGEVNTKALIYYAEYVNTKIRADQNPNIKKEEKEFYTNLSFRDGLKNLSTFDAMDLLLFAKETNQNSLCWICLDYIQGQSFINGKIKKRELTEKQEEVKLLIDELKNSSIKIEEELGFTICFYGEESGWETLKKLHQFNPISTLSLTGEMDIKLFSDFLENCPNLTRLDLDDIPDITEEHLENLSENLQKIPFLTLSSLNIKDIPESLCKKLSDIRCFDCPFLVRVNVPNAASLWCDGCPLLTEIHAPEAPHLYFVNCPTLIKVNASKAIDFFLNGSYPSLIELHAESSTNLDLTHCPSLEVLYHGPNLKTLTFKEGTLDLEKLPAVLSEEKLDENQLRVLRLYAHYIQSGSVDLDDDDAIDMLLFAKKINDRYLSEKCLQTLLRRGHRLSFKENDSLTIQQKNLIDVIVKTKRSIHAYSEFGKFWIKMSKQKDISPKEQWNDLKNLLDFCSIDRLKIFGVDDVALLSEFLELNPNLKALNLGKSSKITDEDWVHLPKNLTKLTSLEMQAANITELPKELSSHLTSIYLDDCAKITGLNVPNAITIYIRGDSSIQKLHLADSSELCILKASKVTHLHLTNCSSLQVVDTKNVEELTIAGCNTFIEIGPFPNLKKLNLEGFEFDTANYPHLFTEKINVETLFLYIDFIRNKPIDERMTNEKALDLLFFAKEIQNNHLCMSCFAFLLNSLYSQNDLVGIYRLSLSNEKRYLVDLLERCRDISISTFIESDNNTFIHMDCQEISDWDVLKELHAFIPITHLQVFLYTDAGFASLANFLKDSNPNLEALYLNSINGHILSSIDISDQDLLNLAENLTQLNNLLIFACEITSIPQSLCNQLKTISVNFCPNIKNLDLPVAEDIKLVNCFSVDGLNIPKAKTMSIEGELSLTEIVGPELKSLFCKDNSSIVNIAASQLDTLSLINCSAVKTTDCSEATYLQFINCDSLTPLHFPNAISFECTGCPKVESINIPDNLFIQLNLNELPNLTLSYDQTFLAAFLLLNEINPDSFTKGAQIEVPKPPHLLFKEPPLLENLSDELELLKNEWVTKMDHVNYANDKTPYHAEGYESSIKNGGLIYTQEELKEGIENLFNIFQSTDLSEETKMQLINLLIEARHIWANDEIDKQTADGSIVRLAVAGIEGMEESIETEQIERIVSDLELIIRLNQIVSLFDRINFTQKDEVGYCDPLSLKDDVSVSVEQVRNGLLHLFDYVKSRNRHLGTPSENPADHHRQLRLFYQNLEPYLQCIAVNLQQIDETSDEDLADRNQHLIDLGIAGLHCGERWFGDAEQIYTLSLPGKKGLSLVSFEDRVHAHDATFRVGVIEDISKREGVINVHVYDQYKRLIGMKYGIRGAGALQGIDDIWADQNLTEEIATEEFEREYTLPAVIVNQRIFFKSLLANYQARDYCCEFLKQTMPSKWEQEHYGEILKTVEKMEKENQPREAIRAVLEDADFYIRPDWSAAKALKNYIADFTQERKNNRPSLEPKDEYLAYEAESKAAIDALKDLDSKMKGLPVEEQKRILIENNVPLGHEFNPDFLDEMRVYTINPAYLDSLMEKDKNGDPMYMLTVKAVMHVLKTIGKIHVKPAFNSPA